MNSWSYQLGHKRGIEPQEYVDSSENVFVEDGKLILRATKNMNIRFIIMLMVAIS
ncbi:hypothetical protein SD457_13370 [Coprobacillaceae bacterium CR2/5/TPMF4]|nr:hypothetical protein SD457_13370 [Coprobacillaceae bacterium CR2/5/TPMF4]